MKTVGRYQIEGELARGGMGVVYRAHDPASGMRVALKALLAGRNASEAQRKRFQREAEVLARLRHPGIVQVLDAGEEGGVPWVALRLVEGEPLSVVLNRRPLAISEVLSLAEQVGGALGAAHAAGVLHRDLKPENVLVTPEGRYVLTDFGLAKDLEVQESIALSKTGMAQGTPGYWAPEQATGKGSSADARTDVYGFGALLYAALTGRPPVEGATFMEVLVATASREPEPPASSRDDVPASLDDAVLACLAKLPEARPETIEAALQILRARTGVRRRRVRRNLLAGLAGAAILTLGVSAGVWGAQLADAQPTPTPSATLPGLPSEAFERYRATYATDPEGALRALHAAAEGGHLLALEHLGRRYLNGVGLPRDHERARHYLERAVDAGSTGAPQSLAIIIVDTWSNAPRSPERQRQLARAEGYLRASAEERHPPAMANLGRLLCLLERPEEGEQWLEEAVESGLDEAKAPLARLLLERGERSRALTLLQSAAKTGSREAMTVLGRTLLGSEPKVGMEWLLKASEAGSNEALLLLIEIEVRGGRYAEARRMIELGLERSPDHPRLLCELGRLYDNGVTVETDRKRALELYLRAHELGHPLGTIYAADVLLRGGPGLQRDPRRAVEVLRPVAEAGSLRATRKLAELYLDRESELHDPRAAAELLRPAAERKDALAMAYYGGLVWKGQGGLKPDPARALSLYRESAELGCSLGALNAGILLEHGAPGVSHDLREAARFYGRASELGHPRAKILQAKVFLRDSLIQDSTRGAQLARDAAKAGNPEAMGIWGWCLLKGVGVPQDVIRGNGWIERGARAGDPYAQSEARKRLQGR